MHLTPAPIRKFEAQIEQIKDTDETLAATASILRHVPGIGPVASTGIAPHHQMIHRLAVVQCGIADTVTADQLVLVIHVEVVLSAVVGFLCFLVQCASASFCDRSAGLSIQSFGTSPFLIAARVVVLRHRHDGRVRELSSARCNHRTVETAPPPGSSATNPHNSAGLFSRQAPGPPDRARGNA